MNSASARASSVLPTPVGPRKRKLPIGRLGSESPARERRSAFATASTASSWPITRSCRRSSMWISFSTSPSISFETGIPVQRRDDLGDVLLGRPPRSAASRPRRARGSAAPARRRSARARGCRSTGASPRARGRSRARPARARRGPRRAARSRALRASIASFSACQRAFSSEAVSLRSASSASIASRRAFEASSFSPFSASRSISSCRMRRSTSSISTGEDSISIFSREAASSIRSIALSGRKRSAM